MTVFSSDAIFQPKIILFHINHKREFFITSVSALYIILSILLSLLLGNKTIFYVSFLFVFIVFKNILEIPLLTRNTRLVPTLAIPADAPKTVVNEQREMPMFVLNKTSKVLLVLVLLFLNQKFQIPRFFYEFLHLLLIATAVNANGINEVFVNGVSTFSINGNPIFINDPRNLPRNPPDCIILDS